MNAAESSFQEFNRQLQEQAHQNTLNKAQKNKPSSAKNRTTGKKK